MDCIILTDNEDIDLSSELTKKQIYAKKYYEINKIKDIQVICECGGHYVKSQRSVHFKRSIHKRYVKNKLNN